MTKFFFGVLVLKDPFNLDYFHQLMTFVVLKPMFAYAFLILARLKKIPETSDITLQYKLKIVKIIAIFLPLPGLIFLPATPYHLFKNVIKMEEQAFKH